MKLIFHYLSVCMKLNLEAPRLLNPLALKYIFHSVNHNAKCIVFSGKVS